MDSDVPIEYLAPNLNKPKFVNLSWFEMSLYVIIWFSAVGYAIYHVFKTGEDYFNDYFLDIYNDFQTGWTWIGRKQDVADSEWIHGLKNLNIVLPNLFIHFIVSEFLKKADSPKLLPVWHIMTGSFFTISYLGAETLFLFLIQPVVYYFVIQFKNKTLVWLSTLTLLISIHYLFDWTEPLYYSNEYLNYECKMHLTMATLGWINLRCLNYFLDALDNPQIQKINLKNFIKITAYCLYLPLLYFGPLILYSDYSSFKWNEVGAKRAPLSERVKMLLLNLIRFGFWLFVVKVGLHYFYVSAIPFQIELIKEMNHFSLYGLGYLMGQFFHMKYVVFYGIGTCLTHFELEIPVPRTPKCIGRIHLYSDMWKHFDRGLYVFLVKYIFKPTAQQAGRLIGSLFCFSFVFIWHGIRPYLLIWSTLNYVGLALEALGKEIADSEEFKKNILQDMDNRMYRRFQCIAASPLFAMSALSFFYFSGGKEVGDIFIERLVLGPGHVKLAVLFVLYCGSQVAMQIKHYEEQMVEKDKPKPEKLPSFVDKIKKIKILEKKPQFKLLNDNRPVGKNMFYCDKLIKFKSTGQIDQRLKNRLLKDHSTRYHDQRKNYSDRRRDKSPHYEYSDQRRIRDRSPTLSDDNLQTALSKKSTKFLNPNDSTMKSLDENLKKISKCVEDALKPQGHIAMMKEVKNKSPKGSVPTEGKVLEDEKRVNELYKNDSMTSKDKKRKLWHFIDKKH